MKLTARNRLFVGLTLFSMFFGAGNLIFPPYLGAQAGQSTIPAMVGFCLSAVCLPMLGVIAVAKSDGLPKLAGRVHPAFAWIFTLLIYLSIGPCLAIPRTATTSFEIAAVPFLPEGLSYPMAQAAYSVLFFAIALLVALKPDKLTDRLGKLLGPGLLLLILAVFVGCLLHPQGAAGTAVGDYAQGAAVTGFLEGYQTMDTIAALNFGFIIALNVRAKGVSEQKHVVGETCLAGVLAGVVLLAVYSALAYIGAQYSAAFQGAQNGTEVLRSMVQALFGPVGSVLLALIFAIACLNTCIGLISCCSDYFAKIFPFWGYRAWAVFFAVISMLISNIGLNQILAVSVPVLGAIYPIAIVLIALAFLHPLIGRFRLVYPAAILLTGIVSIVAALDGIGLAVPGLSQLIRHLPFYADQLGWLLPAVLGIAIGIVLSAMRPQSGWKKDVS